MSEGSEARLRIDKWLWAARFFKTRSLAAHAVEAGKVLVNGARAKPAKGLKPGDELQIRTPVFEYTVRVAQLTERRSSATLAAQLYAETDESKRKREAAKLERLEHAAPSGIRGRPTKRTRRQLQKLRGDPW